MIRPVAILAFIFSCSLALADDVEPWQMSVGNDASSYETVATISQSSQSPIKDEYATKDVFPKLIFQCMPQQGDGISAKIDWQRFISSFNTDVSFKVDEKKRLWLKFGVDSSNKITSAKSSDDSKTLLEYLSGGSVLTIGVTPYSESAVSVTYDLSTLDDSIADLQSECSS